METTLFGKTSRGGYRLLAAVLLAIVLLVLDSRFKPYTDPVRFQLNGLFSPLYTMMSWPGRLMNVMADTAMSDESLHAENAYLKGQLLVLSGRLQKFSELAAENARLRGLLDSTQVVDGRILIAEIIGVDSDPFRQIIILNKGQLEGIYIGQPVLDARGIMGQVIEAPQMARDAYCGSRSCAAGACGA